MWRVFTRRGSYKWIDIVDDLVDSYNNSYHRSIGKTPNSVTGDVKQKVVPRGKVKFKLGDSVRLSKVKGIFAKGYEANWSEEIFTISKIQATTPVTYKVKDWNNEEIIGSFYNE